MKKASMETLINYIDTHSLTELFNIKNELTAELNRGADAKAKNAEAYEAIHDLIVDNLADAPCTCAELYEVIKSKLPEGMGKGKVQYALTHLWQDEIVKIEGKPNTYRRA